MCGIVGFWRFGKTDPADGLRLEKMSNALAHRGPNDFGYLLADSKLAQTQVGQNTNAAFTPDIFLANRRLKILDLSDNARQPIANETNDVFVVFNGAIHNFIELREQLQTRGHIFRTQTDTEVIVHAYEEWGVDCSRHFNGMWAYAIWDARKRRLICSRDRFGMKPLLLAREGKKFYFASEAKAIFSGGEVSPKPDYAFLRGVITRETPEFIRRTAFENITQLPPGHNLIVTQKGQWESAFWNYNERSQNYDFSQPEETFRELFSDSMHLRMRADVPIAVLLSGGLDSSSIAVHVHETVTQKEMHAFTYSVPGFVDDERKNAELVARQSGIELHSVEIEPAQFPRILSQATWHMEDPPRHAQVIARWQLLQAASQRARIVLEGQGADEMLGGYPELYRSAHLQSEKSQFSALNFGYRWPRWAAAYIGLGALKNRSIRSKLPFAPRQIPRPIVLSRELNAMCDPCEPMECFLKPSFNGALTNALWRSHSRQILPYLLHFGDAISMAHSVESRLPFLDHQLVEFVFALPCDDKIRGRVTKHILRRTFRKQLPPAIHRSRRKIGFSTPFASWLSANMEQEVRPHLFSSRARERGLFDKRGLEQCLANFKAGDELSAFIIFRCLALENWFELFLDRNWN